VLPEELPAHEPVPLFLDLIGFEPVPTERAVSWSLLFDVPGEPPAQRAKRIDGRLPGSLIKLPVAITGAVDEDAYHSLAVRDLQRGQNGERLRVRGLGGAPDLFDLLVDETGERVHVPLICIRADGVLLTGNRDRSVTRRTGVRRDAQTN